MAEVVPNRGPQLIAVIAVLLVFSLTAIVLRCYVRISLVKAFGVDDYLMIFAMVCSKPTSRHGFVSTHPQLRVTLLTLPQSQISFILFCAVAATGVHYGTGRHYWDLQPEDISEALKVCTQFSSMPEIRSWQRN